LARKILLADDSVTAQNMGRKILADAGYEVATVNNGSAALKRIAEQRPDLIVLDVYMPGYSGLEVCQRLKETNDTARIPVLLTVGKLEPFKPEEAQRVRAEGFIVKPFEASELLSALSKLEDKIVPRPEPSKPGRFARAIAAVEESGRKSGGDESWKERISFPGKKKKAEAEAKGEDEAAMYNPVNRDLRTVVEKPGEKESKPQQGVEVKAAGGLPEDVTPEELAAIAAAMAQVQGSWADAQSAEALVAKALSKTAAEREAEHTASAPEPQSELKSEPKTQAEVPSAAEVINVNSASPSAAAVTCAEPGASDPTPASVAVAPGEEAQEVPATMAVAPDAPMAASHQPRWMAVPVALASEESAISLEQEMQKAYAAFAAAEANHPGFTAARMEEVAAISPAEAVELPVTSDPEQELAMSAAAAQSAPSIAESEPVAAAVPSAPGLTVSAVQAPASAEAFPSTAVIESASQPEPAAVTSGRAEVAPAGAPVEAQPETAAVPVEHRIEQAAAAEPGEPAHAAPEAPTEDTRPSEAADSARSEEASAAPEAAAQPEPEATPVARSDSHQPEPSGDDASVATTAAAWASWRQSRDAGDTEEKGIEAVVAEAAVPVATPAESAAMAVAAGAEKLVQEASAASPNSDPTAIASIVESVLADLRPKIVEEISKKLSRDKK